MRKAGRAVDGLQRQLLRRLLRQPGRRAGGGQRLDEVEHIGRPGARHRRHRVHLRLVGHSWRRRRWWPRARRRRPARLRRPCRLRPSPSFPCRSPPACWACSAPPAPARASPRTRDAGARRNAEKTVAAAAKRRYSAATSRITCGLTASTTSLGDSPAGMRLGPFDRRCRAPRPAPSAPGWLHRDDFCRAQPARIEPSRKHGETHVSATDQNRFDGHPCRISLWPPDDGPGRCAQPSRGARPL